MNRISVFLCLISLLALSAYSLVHSGEPPIHVSNYEDGAIIRYPAPLLKGRLSDKQETSLEIVNKSSNRDTRQMKGLVHKGRFKALTELVPGENELVLRFGAHELELTLVYKPQTNPRIVRIIYMTDNAGDTTYQTQLANDPKNYIAKLDTAMKLMQTFTAERMYDLGYGRVTFNLELDENGKVKVHTAKGDHPAEYYYNLKDKWWGHVYEWSNKRFPMNIGRNVVIAAYTRYDGKTKKVRGHTALGGGGLALFGSGDLFTWPGSLKEVFSAFMDDRKIDASKVLDDSNSRSTFWGVASTTIGATLHEIGHTLGLPHCKERFGIMTRGFDHFNRTFTFGDPPSGRNKVPYEFSDDEVACFAPISAAALKYNRWFAMDARSFKEEGKPKISLDEESGDFIIEAPNGIRYVGIDVKGNATDFLDFTKAENPPKRLTLSLAELKRRVGTYKAHLRVMDSEGLTTGVNTSSLADAKTFVRKWRFSKRTEQWLSRNSFVEMNAEKLKAIAASAASQELVGPKESFVDFVKHFRGKTTDVAGYAVRKISVPHARRLKLFAGSDDALRIWLNDRLVLQKLVLRPAEPDQDSRTIDLQAGNNTLIVEVSQAGGGWGLFLRLEDEAGKKYRLADDGSLVLVGAN